MINFLAAVSSVCENGCSGQQAQGDAWCTTVQQQQLEPNLIFFRAAISIICENGCRVQQAQGDVCTTVQQQQLKPNVVIFGAAISSIVIRVAVGMGLRCSGGAARSQMLSIAVACGQLLICHRCLAVVCSWACSLGKSVL